MCSLGTGSSVATSAAEAGAVRGGAASQPQTQPTGGCSTAMQPPHRAQSSPSRSYPLAANTAPTRTQSSPQPQAPQTGAAHATTLRRRLRVGCRGEGLRMAPSKPPASALQTCKLSTPQPLTHVVRRVARSGQGVVCGGFFSKAKVREF